MKFVAVTSCPTGIAHTYMAAEALERAAAAAGHICIVETQGAVGATPLGPAVIEAADAVIFAADLDVLGRSRFAGKPIVEVGVTTAVHDPAAVLRRAAAAASSRARARQARAEAAGGADGGAPAAHRADGAGGPVGAGEAADGVPSPVGPGDGHLEAWGPPPAARSLRHRVRQYLMTGVSYMIPFVSAGGILIALGFLLATTAWGDRGAISATQVIGAPLDVGSVAAAYAVDHGIDLAGGPIDVGTFTRHFGWLSTDSWAVLLVAIGGAAFALLVPALSGYIAYAIADRPGIVPGFVGGTLAVAVGAGFLGGIVSGFVAGALAGAVLRWRVPRGMRGLMPVVLVPLLATLGTGLVTVLIIGPPMKQTNDGLAAWLAGLGASALVPLGVLLGLMMCFDLGGPVNKVAYVFATAGLANAVTTTDTPARIMAIVMAAGMVPPLAVALATTLRPAEFTAAERESGTSAWLLGLSFISEGAIPVAAADPLRMIPAFMLGGAVTGGLTAIAGSGQLVPHGGLWVVPLIRSPLLFVAAIAAGTAVSAAAVLLAKRLGRPAAPLVEGTARPAGIR